MKNKKKLKTSVLLENNQAAPQCLAKRKNRQSYYVQVLNTLSKAKKKYRKNEKLPTQISPNGSSG